MPPAPLAHQRTASSGDVGLLHFSPVGPSKVDLDYAELRTVDLATFYDGPAAQADIAETLRQAMHEQGFFTLINHGITPEEIERQVDIAYTVFEKTPLEEKKQLRAHIQETGSYKGFKLRQYYEMENGVTDRIEQFNWSRDMVTQAFPSPMLPFLDEVKAFSEKTHKIVLFNVLRLFAIALDLPMETFVEKHKFDLQDESWLRYMAYYDEFTLEDEAKVKGLWLKGHQDHGSMTILYSQPMSSLQVRNDAGHWQYVKHVPGAIIINCGMFMQWYTGGYFKAANHRVTAPPLDQRNHTRLGVFYFVMPNDDEIPNTLLESPVLREAGVKAVFPPDGGITSGAFSRARVAKVGKSDVYRTNWGQGDVVVEIIAGVEVPHLG